MVKHKRKKEIENYVLKTKESIEALVFFADDKEHLSYLGMLFFESSKKIFNTLYTPEKAKQVMIDNPNDEKIMDIIHDANKVRTPPNVGSN